MPAGSKGPSRSASRAGMSIPISAANGVESDLRELPPWLAGSGLAASALALARSIDDSATSPTARAACARALVQTMAELRSLAPAEKEVDALDELTARRQSRG